MSQDPPGAAEGVPGREAGVPSVRERLERECRVFCDALVSEPASDRVVEAYVRAHAHPSLDVPEAAIDPALTRLAARHRWLARLADAYACLFARRGRFRTKLVTLLALLEAGAPHHERFEPPGGGRASAWLHLAGWGLAAGATSLVATLLFGPIHLFTLAVGGGRTSGRGTPGPEDPAAEDLLPEGRPRGGDW